MKIFRLVLIISLLIETLVAQEYKSGDTLFVWSESGVNIRESYENNSNIVSKLPYGAMVIVVDDKSKSYSYTEIETQTINEFVIPPIERTGRYIHVEIDSIKGFVFSGLLSSLPTLKIHRNHSKGPVEDFYSYFDRVFGTLGVIHYKAVGDSTEFKSRRIVYKNGAILDEKHGVSWWDNIYFIPDISMKEAYLFVNIQRQFEKYYAMSVNEKFTSLEFHPISFDENKYHLQSGPFEETIIRREGQFIILKMGGGN